MILGDVMLDPSVGTSEGYGTKMQKLRLEFKNHAIFSKIEIITQLSHLFVFCLDGLEICNLYKKCLQFLNFFGKYLNNYLRKAKSFSNCF